MSYKKRDWDTTGNEVTKEDFKRIENGVETNDKTIAEQGKQINVLNGRTHISTYKSYGDIGLSNNDFSSVDYNANITKIINAMPNSSVLYLSLIGGSENNLELSLAKKFEDEVQQIGTSNTSMYIVVEKFRGLTNNIKFTLSFETTVNRLRHRQFYFVCNMDSNVQHIHRIQEVATTTKADIPLPYNTGYEDINTSTEKSKISVTNNIVTITLNLKKVDGSNFNADEIFAVMPSSYRPALHTRFDLSCYGGSSIGWDKLTGFVFSNGNIGIKIPKNVIAKNLYGTVTYQI